MSRDDKVKMPEALLIKVRAFLHADTRERLELRETFQDIEQQNRVFFSIQNLENSANELDGRDCLNYLALVAMVGPFLDPRDVTYALEVIATQSSKTARREVEECFQRIGRIVDELGPEWLIIRIKSFPGVFYK